MSRSLPAQLVMRFNGAPRFICGALLLFALLMVLAALMTGCAGGWPLSGVGESRERSEQRDYYDVAGQADGGTGFEQGELPGDVHFIRVGLAHGVKDASVSCRGGFTVGLYADSLGSWQAREGARWLFGAAGGGITGSGPGGGFHMDAGTIRIRPEAAGLGEARPLVFDGVAYRGEIELLPSGRGSLTVVNVVDVESYLRGVVPSEIGARPESEIEAVKAQAVAARTYALASGGRRAAGGFDVYATVDDQVYTGVNGEDPVCDRAILATAGVFMSHSDEPIHAYFHANCGGRTDARHEVWELPRVPYLRQVWDSPEEDQFNDAFCSAGAHFRWTESWNGEEIARLVREQLPNTASTPVRQPLGDVKDLRVTVRTPSGRVRWLEVETDAGTYRVFGDRVRWLL
ncbi:MAG: SpoIID/LytB domain-containing protein, partial [Candidatus Eisenbacteria sp.]|nr:SpoIID/LytB domain-containing protein [Candidatus Eisenbacteria bacterium]